MRVLLAALLFSATVYAVDTTPVPKLTSPMMDEAHVIRPETLARLDRVLREVNQRGIAQVQVLTIRSLNEEPIESYSLRVVDEWKIGEKKKDNGVLILVSVGDRRSRIEVGRGLEGAIPDITAKRIQSEYMRPKFKTGDYSAGIEAGVAEVVALADKEFAGDLPRPVHINWSTWIPLIELLFVLFLIIISALGSRRRRGGFFYGGGWGGASGSSWGGSTGSGWGGGSSSGGWGGGGGGFGGGGASDSW